MKYVAEIHAVGEVTLIGGADANYWRDRLRPLDLQPALASGDAEVMLSATSASYLGLPFCELSISVFVNSKQSDAPRAAVYLTHAYNSNRLLAFCERSFFRTPYYPAQLAVSAKLPISVTLGPLDRPRLHLVMAVESVASHSRDEQGEWSGPLFLPPRGTRPCDLFFARLKGATDYRAFEPAADRFVVCSTTEEPALLALVESNFAPRQWSIRPNATHARTKTYTRVAAGL